VDIDLAGPGAAGRIDHGCEGPAGPASAPKDRVIRNLLKDISTWKAAIKLTPAGLKAIRTVRSFEWPRS
jgi:hypothetical protein